jgi:hypothetical protein
VPGLSISAMRALNPPASSTVPAALEYSPLSAGQKRKSPGRADRGFNFLEGAWHGGLGGGTLRLQL